MAQHREMGLLVFAIVGICACVIYFVYSWYSGTYKAGLIARDVLAELASSLRKASSSWVPTSDVSMRRHWNPFWLSDTRVDLRVEGLWEGRVATIQFRFAVGLPDAGFWGRLNYVGDQGIYQPPATCLSLVSKLPLAEKASLDRYSDDQSRSNKLFAAIGLAPGFKRVSEDFFSFGTDAEVARLFPPPIVARARSFPRQLFGPAFEGLVIEGNRAQMKWAGHETDPDTVVAGFRLLQAVIDAASSATQQPSLGR